jgi:hypothetical protein
MSRPERRYFVRGREVGRREALGDWLRFASGEGQSASQARREFEVAEELKPRPIGEVAQAQRALDAAGIVITGVEGF